MAPYLSIPSDPDATPGEMLAARMSDRWSRNSLHDPLTASRRANALAEQMAHLSDAAAEELMPHVEAIEAALLAAERVMQPELAL